MSTRENSSQRYVVDIIANSYTSDTLSRVGRTPKKLEGPLTFRLVVGRWIRNQRKLRSWKQEKLTEVSGIAQGDLSDFENGKAKISSEHIDALLEAFEIEARDLFSLLVGTVPEVEREIRTASGELKAVPARPMRKASLPPAPPTHTKDPTGYRKKKVAAEVSADPPTSHRQG